MVVGGCSTLGIPCGWSGSACLHVDDEPHLFSVHARVALESPMTLPHVIDDSFVWLPAPGSDQFHEGIGTSTVERLDRNLIRSTTRISNPSPVCTRKPTKISLMESPRRDGRNKFQWWRATTAREEGRGEEFAE
ncbi:ninja-family protein Os03g0419100-like [Dorcoceras hygrometricum]|uniref:Ninja-family protein Os03g0419100-like n=1 Tax=Dorcoceras hygrometricum TaxID=472368 RepID=A0A2Z7BTP5_9LAMI|nr:ninja-family protein Os03g0419100-like [Dorcoceras hygrometricum]